jgi:hypothetical protein
MIIFPDADTLTPALEAGKELDFTIQFAGCNSAKLVTERMAEPN